MNVVCILYLQRSTNVDADLAQTWDCDLTCNIMIIPHKDYERALLQTI